MTSWQVACLDEWAPEIRDEIAAAAPAELSLEFPTAFAVPSHRQLLATSDFLLVGTAPVTAEVLDHAPRLRLVHKWGIGVDSIDLPAAERSGVGVAITAGANAHAVAEHAVMMILATLRRLPHVDSELRKGNWLFKEMRVQCRQLAGRTVGILGLGNIGRAVARRLQGFDVDLVYYDPVRPGTDVEADLRVEYRDLPDLLAASDVLTVHCPGGVDNHHFLDAAALASMKDSAILVNTARGEIVDAAALTDALVSGHLAGAALDVFEREPVPADDPLLTAGNVVLSPHTAASVLDNVEHVARHAFGNMLRSVRGEAIRPQDLVVPPRRDG